LNGSFLEILFGVESCNAESALRRNDHFLGNRACDSTLYIGFVMKKFINRPEDVVEEMMQGLGVLHPSSARPRGRGASP
jgi:hypothetical protein